MGRSDRLNIGDAGVLVVEGPYVSSVDSPDISDVKRGDWFGTFRRCHNGPRASSA
jgi:hypothetical protein